MGEHSDAGCSMDALGGLLGEVSVTRGCVLCTRGSQTHAHRDNVMMTVRGRRAMAGTVEWK